MEYVSAGESHGPALTAIVTGVPAGLSISEKNINSDLARRQGGYGRGGRQKIEKDRVQVLSGVRFGKTLGSPVCLSIKNDDWENWTDRMAVFGDEPTDLVREVTPRPGHADLLGVLKNDQTDCRNILERSSARETAIRVAASGIAREFLAEVGVEVYSYVVSIGGVGMIEEDPMRDAADYRPLAIEMSELRCPDEEATEAMKARIDEAKELGQSLGGTFRVVVNGSCLRSADSKKRETASPRSLAVLSSRSLLSKVLSSVSGSRMPRCSAMKLMTRSISIRRRASCAGRTVLEAWKGA